MKEMAFGRASAKEHPNKTVRSPNQMQADQSGLRNRETYRTTRSQHRGKNSVLSAKESMERRHVKRGRKQL